eukprot:7883120-Pyramimonas_sp.AAC.1
MLVIGRRGGLRGSTDRQPGSHVRRHPIGRGLRRGALDRVRRILLSQLPGSLASGAQHGGQRAHAQRRRGGCD